MFGDIVYQRFLRIFGLLSLTILVFLATSVSAKAQAVVPSSYNPTTGFLSTTDTAGNTYLVNLSNVSLASRNDVPGFFSPTNGTQSPASFVINPTGGGNFTINGIPANQKLLSCSANSSTTTLAGTTTTIVNVPQTTTIVGPSPFFIVTTITTFVPTVVIVPTSTVVPNYPSTCYLTDTPRALLASIKQNVRSQSDSVIEAITDRLRGLSQDLAAGSLPAVQTPPGGTVILDNFSSNPAPKYNGLSAGSTDTRWGVWGNASGSYLQNNNPAFAFKGPSVVAVAGIDYILDRQWILGLSAGYTHADLSLSPLSITRTANGGLVGPYAAYIINPNWSIDALVNWTSLSNNLGAPLPFPSGSYHSSRWTGASNLNYFGIYNGIKLTGSGGYAYTWEGGNTNAVLPSSLANNVRYGAIRLRGEAAYDFGAWEPYVPLTFEYETTTPADGTSRAALIPGVGLRYRWSDTLTGGLLFESTEIKTHTRDMLVSAHLRLSF